MVNIFLKKKLKLLRMIITIIIAIDLFVKNIDFLVLSSTLLIFVFLIETYKFEKNKFFIRIIICSIMLLAIYYLFYMGYIVQGQAFIIL